MVYQGLEPSSQDDLIKRLKTKEIVETYENVKMKNEDGNCPEGYKECDQGLTCHSDKVKPEHGCPITDIKLEKGKCDSTLKDN